MAFYTDRWIILNILEDKVFLVRKKKQEIILKRIVGDLQKEEEKVLADDVLIEYDMDLNQSGKIFMLYQNKERNLILRTLDDGKLEEIKLTSEPIGEVVDLNIHVVDKKIHILYLVKVFNEDNIYNIVHHYYNGANWEDFIVEEIIAMKVLNPLKVVKEGDNIFLSYYKNDRKVCIKKFDVNEVKWGESFIVSHSQEEKLFVDMIKTQGYIHIAYCEYIEGSLVVMYKKIELDNGKFNIKLEEIISNEGSPSHPNIILFHNKLWISWLELNKILSRESEDKGDNWGAIYQWNKTRNMDFLRYKYISRKKDDNINLDYSFGTISPQVKLIGFGPIDEAAEVPLNMGRKRKNPL